MTWPTFEPTCAQSGIPDATTVLRGPRSLCPTSHPVNYLNRPVAPRDEIGAGFALKKLSAHTGVANLCLTGQDVAATGVSIEEMAPFPVGGVAQPKSSRPADCAVPLVHRDR
jgi:hypothetical protein